MTTTAIDFHVENLENRQLLAGNVDVGITAAGDLTVTGDNEGNRISIFVNASNQLVITAKQGTTINDGVPDDGITMDHDGLRDLRIRMKGGDDVVHVAKELSLFALSFRHGTLNLGGGNDYVTIARLDGAGAIEFTGNLKIALGGGEVGAMTHQVSFVETVDQGVVIDRVDVGGNLTIKGAATFDHVDVGAQLVANQTRRVDGRTSVNLGGGDDYLRFEEREMTGPVRISMGSGNDELALGRLRSHARFRALGGAGTDSYVEFSFTHDVEPVVASFET